MFDIYMEQYRDDMLRDLSNFIKIESVKGSPEPNNPYGKGIFNALMYILNITDKMDFECVNLFGHMAYLDYGAGDEMLAILTHIDIVPAGEGWTKNPFGGEIENGRIYGRGAIDNKGPAIAALYALKALSDNLVNLNKKVRLVFGCDEESGWSDMDFYKQHEQIPDIAFSPDGEFPIINAEKGLIHIRLDGKMQTQATEGIQVLSISAGERVNVVPNKAYCLLKADFSTIKTALDRYTDPEGASFEVSETTEGVKILAKGKSTHGARPEDGINAASALLLFINTLPLGEGSVSNCIRSAATHIGHGYNGQNCGLDLQDEVSGKLTFSLGILQFDSENFKMIVDVRYPVSYKELDIMQKIEETFGNLFKIKIQHALPPHYMDENSDLIVKLKEAYEEITGEKAYCLAIGGATYARAFKNAVTFGPRFPGRPNLEHGPDEYMEIDDLLKLSKIIVNALIKICGEKSD